MAELITTDFIGVLFLVGFKEIREGREFRVPMRTFKAIGEETVLLLRHQRDLVTKMFSKENFRTIKSRFGTWFRGEIPTDMPRLRGELASLVAMSWLISKKFEHLDGPLGEEFIGAIRDRFPKLQDSSIEDISEHMAEYDAEQLDGVLNSIKGKLFERLVARHENQDSDDWVAVLHEDESWPGSDMILTNEQTGESIEISLKASSHAGYLEEALARYPDIPILATDEVAESLAGNEMVISAGLSDDEITQVTAENFDRLLGELQSADVADVAAAGVAMKTTIGLWPFVVAYMKDRISQEQLSQACVAVLGDAGKSLAARLAYAVALGPVFAWWLLARGVMLVSRDQEIPSRSDSRLLRIT
jgi:hypothetical protein